jgi:hypothetical protein
MHNEQLVCTIFLSWIGFLSKTALSQPSQLGKEGLDEGVSTNSRVTLSNCVRCWMHWGGSGLTSRRGMSHIGNFGLATNLSLFFLRRFCILCCVPQKPFFLVGNEYLEVKRINLPPTSARDVHGTLVVDSVQGLFPVVSGVNINWAIAYHTFPFHT